MGSLFATKKFGNCQNYMAEITGDVCYKKIWKWVQDCLLQKNLEIGSSFFATKKFGNCQNYMAEMAWGIYYLLQKILEMGSRLFATKKFGNGYMFVC